MVPRYLIWLWLFASLPAHAADGLDAAAGRALFERSWISAPSSQHSDSGLGPLYDARSCNACHAGGGAGHVSGNAVGAGMIVRLGSSDGHPDPIYGEQLQTRALPGIAPEAELSIGWDIRAGRRVPTLDIARLHYGSFDPQTRAGVRRAPSLFGLALLAQIPDAEILSHAKNDGTSGKPGWVVSSSGERKLGRWGWKATSPDLTTQVEAAFQRDFGMSTSGRPGAYGECTARETACRNAAHGAEIEAPDTVRDLIVAYLLALPPPQANAPPSHRGFAVFRDAGCLGCHAVLKTASGQDVPAYTDLLLHDLGPGLDDGIAEGAAKPGEWRTAPLWDVAESLARGGLLHDGRARSIAEAVSWHGGEASRARTTFNALSSNDRKVLEAFLLGH